MGKSSSIPEQGEMNRTITTFALYFSLLALDCLSQKPPDNHGSDSDKTNKPEDWMREKCCPVMTVESASDETKNEMYALVEEIPWSQAKKENCSSNCAYVKMKELNNLMEEMMNMTNMDTEEDLENLQMLLGKKQMEEIKM